MDEFKAAIPCSGDWVAVYAREPRENWTLEIVPVLFWAALEDDKGIMNFVGMVTVAHAIAPATSPTLLGYARHDEEPQTKFREALEAWKANHADGGVGEGEDDKLAERIRGHIQDGAEESEAEGEPLMVCQCNFLRTGCGECANGEHDSCLTACTIPPEDPETDPRLN